MPLTPQDRLLFEGSRNAGSWLSVESLFRETMERCGQPSASMTSDIILSLTQTALFTLNAWTARSQFSWMRQRGFFDVTPLRQSWPLLESIRNVESVVATQMQMLPEKTSEAALEISDNLNEGLRWMDLINGSTFDTFDIQSITDDPVVSIGWTQKEPVVCSCFSLLPTDESLVLSCIIQAKTGPRADASWTTVKIIPPHIWRRSPLSWVVIENPPPAYGWRVVLNEILQATSIANLIPTTDLPAIQHLWFGQLNPNPQNAQGGAQNGIMPYDPAPLPVTTYPTANVITGDRILGEIAYSDWMALNQKQQTAQQPTSFAYDNQKQPYLYIWPLLPLHVPTLDPRSIMTKQTIPDIVPGIVYSAYRPPVDIHELFQLVDVPAVAIDALAYELALRWCMKVNAQDQMRLSLLREEAARSFQTMIDANAQTTSTSLRIQPNFQPIAVR